MQFEAILPFLRPIEHLILAILTGFKRFPL
jgi:hypothetical protein